MVSVVFTMNQHADNTYIIDVAMNSVVFSMNQYPGNTCIIDFAMNSIVFTMKQHRSSTHKIGLTRNKSVYNALALQQYVQRAQNRQPEGTPEQAIPAPQKNQKRIPDLKRFKRGVVRGLCGHFRARGPYWAHFRSLARKPQPVDF